MMFQPTESVPVTQIVDFEEQLETFERMVADREEKRLMFIQAPGGRGKTCLMRVMRNHCRDQGIHCCWVDFRGVSFDSPHLTLAREVCEQLALPPRSLAQALLPLTSVGAAGDATAEIGGDVSDSTIITQVLTKVSPTDEALRRDYVRQRLRRAFATDLSAVEELVVCFFDSFEDVSGEEESWVLQALLGPVREGQFQNVIVVTAGWRWPKINDWEWEDDAYLENGLPPMSVGHIQQFAQRVGYMISEQEAHFCWRACRGGMPIFMGIVVKNLRAVQELWQ